MTGVNSIVGGQASTDEAVVALRVRAACGQPPALVCSAVRLSPRALLTAAHCATEPPGLLEVVLGPSADASVAASARVAAVRLAPAPLDLAVVITTDELPGATHALGDLPATAAGATVTVVGYGSDGATGLGDRRDGTATIARVDAAAIELAPGPALTCAGDSGGAVLLDGALVAITSFGDPDCAISSTAVRVDAARAFLDDAVRAAAATPLGVPGPGRVDCGDDSGGCAIASSSGSGVACLFALLVVALARRARRARVASIALVALVALAACGSDPRGPCGDSRQHGAAPPRGQLLWCSDADGVKHGAYREWWPSGTPRLDTAYRAGQQHGRFTRWFESGQLAEQGELRDGLRVGAWRTWYPDGRVERELDHRDGSGGSTWTLYREADGTRWITGGFRAQREHGHFVEYYPDGTKTAEGDFTDGVRTGAWQFWNPDGTLSSIELGAYAAGAFGAEP